MPEDYSHLPYHEQARRHADDATRHARKAVIWAAVAVAVAAILMLWNIAAIIYRVSQP